jgi:hypothetical protein
MVCGVTLEKAIEAVGHAGGTTTREVVTALKKLGVKPKSESVTRAHSLAMLPKRALVRIAWEETRRISKKEIHIHIWYHLAVWWDGCWYDPGCNKGRCLLHKAQPEHCARMTSFLPL